MDNNEAPRCRRRRYIRPWCTEWETISCLMGARHLRNKELLLNFYLKHINAFLLFTSLRWWLVLFWGWPLRFYWLLFKSLESLQPAGHISELGCVQTDSSDYSHGTNFMLGRRSLWLFAHIDGLKVKVNKRDTRYISNQVTKGVTIYHKKPDSKWDRLRLL